MKKTITLLLCFALGVLQAQQAILTSGGNAIGSGGSASYSIGQMTYNTTSGTNGSVAQGVQQAFEISTTLGIEDNSVNLLFIVYPNPTYDFLTLKISNFNKNNMEYALFDIQGRMLVHQKIKLENTKILMRSLATDTYFLKVTNENRPIKTFKIIKN